MKIAINYKIKSLIDKYFGEEKDLMEHNLSPDALRVSRELGLENILFDGLYHESPKNKVNFSGMLKDFSEMYNSGKIKDIIIFGSLVRGHYVDNLSAYEALESKLKTSEQKFWYHTFLADMFNYPFGSDIDLCFIVSDEYYKKDKEEIKSDISSILLSNPKYHFEHFTIIPKTQMYQLLESFKNSNFDSIKDKNFELLSFRIEPDYYPKGLSPDALNALIEKREILDKKVENLKSKLEELKGQYEQHEVKSKILEYNLNRLNLLYPEGDVFGHERVIKSLSNAYFINEPSFTQQIKNINSYAKVSESFYNSFIKFEKELKDEEIGNKKQLNKWHKVKVLRNEYLKQLEKKTETVHKTWKI